MALADRAGRHLHRHRRLRQAARHLPARFANAVNFRGFPHMPGPDYILAVAKPGEP